MQLPDGFVPVPQHPAYLVHPDGRVWSLRKYDRVAERGSLPSPWRRVRIDGLDVRVRDLVWLTFGQTGDYEARVNAELVESGWFERLEEPS